MDKKKIGNGISTVLLTLMALAVTGLIVFWMGFNVGTGRELVKDEAKSVEVFRNYDIYVNNSAVNALEGLVPVAESEEDEGLVIQKVYMTDRDQIIAPEPDQSCFGETENPEMIDFLVNAASKLLDGQDVMWDSERPRMPGSTIRYYLDETIMVISWKEVVNGAVYTFSEVKVMDPSQFRRYMADDTFGAGTQYKPSQMAQTVNAVVAMNGDFYQFRGYGIITYKGEVKRVEGRAVDTCFVDYDGNLHFVYQGEITDEETAKQYVENNNICFSLAFGPVLIEDYEIYRPQYYSLGEINDIYARAAIAQLDELHYLLLTVNHEGNSTGYYGNCATTADVAKKLHEMGCPKAYTLDGGQTATMIFNDKLINAVEFGNERYVSDIIYFSTAIPDEEGD